MNDMNLLTEVSTYLRHLGVRPDMNGYRYLRDLTVTVCTNPFTKVNVAINDVAKRYHVQKSRVESEMKSAIAGISVETVNRVCDFYLPTTTRLQPLTFASCIAEKIQYVPTIALNEFSVN